ncbi:MAG: hypothetical protein JWN04_1678 [Myxococcaceae bacterium]|nr:hypothetical protein [Myxococcaceae bacterium]
MKRRVLVPLVIYLVAALVYVSLLGTRALGPTPDNHYVHLALSWFSGELGVLGNTPPGSNDWALYNGRWFVSFPPFPAVVIAPVVAIWGLATRDALFWALLAGLAPALLFVLLRRLSELGQSTRSTRDNLALTALFAFGTVFFFVAVQGTVWFAAQVVASILLILFLLFAFDARSPWLAGLLLGLLIVTRPPGTPLVGLVFIVEALRRYRREGALAPTPGAHPARQAWQWLRGAELGPVLKAHAIVAVPVLAVLSLALWFNYARFDDPFSFGHEHLQIRWRQRIDEWGLLNLHYFSKNLAVFTSSLPWLYDRPPYLKISLHGLALWFTTPALLLTLWPKQLDARIVGLWLAVIPIALVDLCYQNSGWVQFGYRFALDYMPMLIVLLALGRRRFGPGFYLCLAFAVVVNTFGALTFDRAPRFYDNDGTQNRLFQPD